MRRGSAPLVKEQLKRIDDAIYRLERLIVIASMLGMAIVVFLDVVHRTFGGQESKFVAMVVRASKMVGSEIERGGATYQSVEAAGPWILWPLAIAIVYFGIRTANQAEQTPPTRALMYAAAGVVASFGLIKLMLRLVPNGFIWAQPLALVLTLWVGFIGASMCTHDNKHLKVEAAQRLIPEKYKPYVRGVSNLVTAGICLMLLWLAMRLEVFYYLEYVDTEGTGGQVEILGAPKFIAFAALPVSFGLMSARFFVLGIAAFLGHVQESGELSSLLDDAAPKTKPSEVQTEVSGITDPGRRKPKPPSEIPTEAVKLKDEDEDADEDDRLFKQSKVPTDPHPEPDIEPGAPRPAPRETSGELGSVEDVEKDMERFVAPPLPKDEDADDEEEDKA